MPTPQWFQENPKVSTYIPRELHNALETWMKERQIKKVSQALIKILETQLGFSPDTPEKDLGQYATIDQLEELRNEIKGLTDKLNILKTGEPTGITSKVKQLELMKEKAVEELSDRSDEWITGREAYTLYGDRVTFKTFNGYSPERLQKEFGLKADLSRRIPGGPPSRWIRKPYDA
jgi:hypothetical protein